MPLKCITANSYTDEEILLDVLHIIGKLDNVSLKNYIANGGKFSQTVFAKHFGSWTKMVQNYLYLDPGRHYGFTKEELINDIKRIIKETNCTGRENYIKKGKYSREAIKKHYKSWNELLIELGYKPTMLKPSQYTKEDILKEYSLVCKKEGRLLKALEYRKVGSYSESIINRVFGSFSNLRKELGLPFRIKEYSDEDVKKIFLGIYQEYGFISADLINKTRLNMGTVTNKYGSIENACKKFDIHYDKPESMFRVEVEKIIASILGNDYESEKTFEWLKFNRNLYLDLYYPKLNLAIEIDGLQHDKYIEYFHKDIEGFKKVQKRDRHKDKLLKEHNISLIRIKPSDVANIKQILEPYKLA